MRNKNKNYSDNKINYKNSENKNSENKNTENYENLENSNDYGNLESYGNYTKNSITNNEFNLKIEKENENENENDYNIDSPPTTTSTSTSSPKRLNGQNSNEKNSKNFNDAEKDGRFQISEEKVQSLLITAKLTPERPLSPVRYRTTE